MKFLLTKELGRLAKWLRILGFDSEYFQQDNTSSVIIQALRDDRIIITRNCRLVKSGALKVLLLKHQDLKQQLKEILKLTNIPLDKAQMFTRCIICNQRLIPIEKERVKDKVPEYVFKTQDEFITCPKCLRIYWQGTHWGNVEKTLREVI